jgi:methionyl-tRNA formyltransferase
MGTPEFAATALARLCDAHEVVAVYTRAPKPAGRGQQPKDSAVARLAAARGIPVHAPASLKSAEAQAAFAALCGPGGAEIAVVAAYGLILPPAVLAAPRLGCINIHASLLPRWRGAAPIQRAIMAGDTETGVTIMQMDAGLDTGPMLLARAVPIDDATTADALHDRLAAVGAELVLEALAGLAAGTLKATPQPAVGATHAAKIDKAEAHIDFAKPAVAVLRQIHGLSPFPGAWFARGPERVRVLKVDLAAPDGTLGAPGAVLDAQGTIACSRGAIRLALVQRAGKAPTDAAAFLRGYALPPGTVLL